MTPREGDTLQDLNSQEQSDLLDTVDSLRSQGVSHYVSLPQIIVCGDQSSGKSSVLQAISGFDFPIKDKLCTCFPTELVLRKSPKVTTSMSIVPDHSRSDEEKRQLYKFKRRVENPEDLPGALPEIIESAKKKIGISERGKAFASDILRIEVSGPSQPQLTIVDLPGVIHAKTQRQNASDIKLVKKLVKKRMKEKRSIILVVVSAKNDYANQAALNWAKATDKDGLRSLGVITKPDMLTPGSGTEESYLELAQNKDIEFRLGWHVLKNVDSEDKGASIEDRDAAEETFFAEAPWDELPKDTVGIASLRRRLSKILFSQIAAELPNLIEEIDRLLNQCEGELNNLGEPRITPAQQRRYLIKVSNDYQNLVTAGINGSYDNAFFSDPFSETGAQKRMRAALGALNSDFESTMHQSGCYRETVESHHDEDETQIPMKVTKEKFLDHVIEYIKVNRGRELPGTTNPMVIKDLFNEQSLPWNQITEAHINSVKHAVRDFLQAVVVEIADEEFCDAAFEFVIDPVLDNAASKLDKEVGKLLKWRGEGHPTTYDRLFTETLQKTRKEANCDKLLGRLKEHFVCTSSANTIVHTSTTLDLGVLADKLSSEPVQSMDRFAASEALLTLDSFYKVKQSRKQSKVS